MNIETTVEKLKEALNKIGWDIRGKYPNRFIYDHKNKRQQYRVLDDKIEVLGFETSCVCFYFKGSAVAVIEGNTVSLGTDECFVLFMNHSSDVKPINKHGNDLETSFDIATRS